MPDALRLDKRLARLVPCSRGDAQRYIENGWVTVDGVVIEEPQAPVTDERIVLSPYARLEAPEPATLLLHKPPGVAWTAVAPLATPATHWDGDLSSVRPLKRHLHRLTPLVPLDEDASGLVVLTQDGRVHRRLTEDAGTLEHEYVVDVTGAPAPFALRKLAEGLRIDGRTLPACKVSWQSEQRLRFAIKDVRPGQLPAMCAEVGLTATAQRRLRIGRVPLAKLPVGAWRYLPVGERF